VTAVRKVFARARMGLLERAASARSLIAQATATATELVTPSRPVACATRPLPENRCTQEQGVSRSCARSGARTTVNALTASANVKPVLRVPTVCTGYVQTTVPTKGCVKEAHACAT